MSDLDPVSRYYVAAAKHRRQLRRFFNGPVDSWQSTYEADVGGPVTAFAIDKGLATSRSELEAAIAALTPAQKDQHVLGLGSEVVKARDYERAVKQARVTQ